MGVKPYLPPGSLVRLAEDEVAMYIPSSFGRHIRHKPRTGEPCSDSTEWLVLEESPSFFIVYRQGVGLGMKQKSEYEIVPEGVAI